MKRRVISRLIVLILAFTLVYGFLTLYKGYTEERYISGELLDAQTGGYFGGNGDISNPYIISKKADMEYLSTSVASGNTYKDKYFSVVASVGSLNLGNFSPIGTTAAPFNGSFDGNHVEFKLDVKTEKEYQGLFGVVGYGTIKNLSVKGSITAASHVGAVVGLLQNAGTVENVYNLANIEGVNYVGGLVGRVIRGTVKSGYNTGNITATGSHAGGVVGYLGNGSNNSALVVIRDVYNRGEILAHMYAGGIVGYAEHTNQIVNAYNAGLVSANSGANGITYESNTLRTIRSNVYYDISILVSYDQKRAVKPQILGNDYGKTSDFLLGENTKLSTDNWHFEKQNGDYAYYPQLKVFAENNNKEIKNDSLRSVEYFVGNGLGTKEMPFLIKNAEDMYKLSEDVLKGNSYLNFYFKVDDKIEQIELGNFNAIGTSAKPFQGIFDGNGVNFVLEINKTAEDYQGLFGYITTGAVLENFSISGSITGKSNVGSAVGRVVRGIVRNIYNEATVTAIGSYAGGIAGFIGNGESNNSLVVITNTYNRGEILAKAYAGGIVGYAEHTNQITNAYNAGLVSADSTASGVAFESNTLRTNRTNTYYDITVTANYAQKNLVKPSPEPSTQGINSGIFFKNMSNRLGSGFDFKEMGQGYAYYPQLSYFSKNSNPKIAEKSLESVKVNIGDGLGTEDLPFIIKNVEELIDLRTKVSNGNTYKGFYFKIADEVKEMELGNWEAIGTTAAPFNGSFDGNHVEFKLDVKTEKEYQGLFGVVGYGTIKNLSVKGSITAASHVGAVVGLLQNAGTVENVYNLANIEGVNYVGGLVGRVIRGTVKSGYNTGNITATGSHAGGVVGYLGNGSNNSALVVIRDVYNRGEILAHMYAGGIVGYAEHTNQIVNAYNAGLVSANSGANGITYESNTLRTIRSNVYYDVSLYASYTKKRNNIPDITLGGNRLDKTTFFEDSMVSKGFSSTTWFFKAIEGNYAYYPQLRVFSESENERIVGDSIQSVITNPFMGDGTEASPYIIRNAKDMEILANSINEEFDALDTYYLVSSTVYDIDLNTVDYKPIGSKETPFKGHFDGNYANFNLDLIGDNYQGLFGYISKDATIKNLSTSGNLEGKDYVGSIVAYNEGIVENVYSRTNVKGNNYVSGLIGLNLGFLNMAYNTGEINGTGDYVGGLVGFNKGLVSNGFNGSRIRGNKHLGAIIGYNDNGEITSLYYDETIIKFDDIENINKPIRGISNIDDTHNINGLLKEEIHGLNIIGKSENQLDFDDQLWTLTDVKGLYDYYPQIKAFASHASAKIKENSIISARTIRFAAGNGTKKNPYIIRDENDMKALSDVTRDNDPLTGLYFKVMDGVEVLDLTPTELGFAPIGPNASRQFKGGFDGNNTTIILNINQSGTDYRGLFGYLGVNSEITNIRLEGNIVARNRIGALAGEASGAIIENIYNNITVTGGQYTSGLIGYISDTKIINSYNMANITSSSRDVGGIVGLGQRSSIINSFNYGNIQGTQVIGGIIGYANGNMTLENVYNRGSIRATVTSGDSWTGGIIGASYTNSTLINSYSAGSVITRTNNRIGGIIGGVSGTTYEENSYYDSTIIEADLLAKGYYAPTKAIFNKENQDTVRPVEKNELTNTQLLDESIFEYVKAKKERVYYPQLRIFSNSKNEQVKKDSLQSVESYIFVGDGTELAPYIIVNKYDMETLSNLVNSGITFKDNYFKVKENVESMDLTFGIDFNPIGSKQNPFEGNFDGKYTRFNVDIKSGDYTGLFGYTSENASIKNLSVSGKIKGNNYTGSVVGYNEGKLTNVYSIASVEGSDYTAGIAGYNSGDINSVYHIGDLLGANYVGGIVGYNNGFVKDAYVSSTIFGKDNVGGIIGFNDTGIVDYVYYNESKVDVSNLNAYKKPIYAVSNAENLENVKGVTTNDLYSKQVTFSDEKNWLKETSSGFYAYYPQLIGFTTNKNYAVILTNSKESVTVSRFNEGSGTETDPYIIRTEYDMEAVSQMTQAGYTLEGIFFKVAEDVELIDLTNLKTLYIPIGNLSKPFQGSFEGTHTRFILSIERTNAEYQGLFGVIGTKGIVNAVSTEGKVSAKNFAGGIAGRNYGLITNSYNLADIYTTSNYAGGIVGYHEGTLNNTYNTGTIHTDYRYAGGIAGASNKNSEITNSYNTGNISSKDHYVGGIIGYAYGNIKNTYSSGLVTGYSLGGVAGVINGGNIENSYYILETMVESSITNKPTKAVGNQNDTETVKGIYKNQLTGDELFGITLDMNVFILRQSDLLDAYYPQLKVFTESNIEKIKEDSLTSVHNKLFYGEGTENLPYKVYSAYDLRALGIAVKQDFNTNEVWFKVVEKQNLDLELIRKNYVPIGTKNNPFDGNFDGNSTEITVNIDSSEDYQGLFGFTSPNAILKNFTLKGEVKGNNYVGGLVGYNQATLENIISTVDVIGNNYVGGMSGYNKANVSNIAVKSNIVGSQYVGGLFGIAEDTNIELSYFMGTINASSNYVGGLVSHAINTEIKNSFAYGKIESSGSYTGGLVGKLEQGSILNSYAQIDITSNGKTVGGIVGYNSGSISNVFYSGRLKAQDILGGIAGISIGSIEKAYYNQTELDFMRNVKGYKVPKTAIYNTTDTEDVASRKLEGMTGKYAIGMTVEQMDLDPQLYFVKEGYDFTSYFPELKVFKNHTNEVFKEDSLVSITYNKIKGKGTVNDPYIIYDGYDMMIIYQYVANEIVFTNKYFKVADGVKTIDLTLEDIDYAPIGTNEFAFDANFNGNGANFIIKLNDITQDYRGIFHTLGKNAVVSNLSVSGTISGKSYVGSVAGRNLGKIENVSSSVKIYSSDGNDIGGIVGYNEGIIINATNNEYIESNGTYTGGIAGQNSGTISQSFNKGRIVAYSNVGGITGKNIGTITNTHNSATINGETVVGGIAGETNGSITFSYNSGNITAQESIIGGIAGIIKNTTGNASVNDVYNSGIITSNGKDISQAGGIVGNFDGGNIYDAYHFGSVYANKERGMIVGMYVSGSISRTYYDIDKLEQDKHPKLFKPTEAVYDKKDFSGIKGLYHGQMIGNSIGNTKNQMNIYHAGSFTTLPSVKENSFYPQISYFANHQDETVKADSLKSVTSKTFILGKGTKADPYIIRNESDWIALVQSTNSGNDYKDVYFKIHEIVDELNFMDAEEDYPFVPVGLLDTPFNGILDGNGANIKIKTTESRDYQALFGHLGESAEIRNLSVSGIISGNKYVAGIAALNKGLIEQVYNQATIEGNEYVSGISGSNEGIIRNVYNHGTIKGKNYVAGIVGDNKNTLENSYNSGVIYGKTNVGAIAGFITANSITNSYYDKTILNSYRDFNGYLKPTQATSNSPDSDTVKGLDYSFMTETDSLGTGSLKVNFKNANGIWTTNYNLSDLRHYPQLAVFSRNSQSHIAELSKTSTLNQIYEITFDENKDNDTNSNVSYVIANQHFKLYIPQKVGYKFTGWYLHRGDEILQVTNEKGESLRAFDFNENIKLIANYEIAYHTVTFVDGNGKVVSKMEVRHGFTAETPIGIIPSKKSDLLYVYKFVKWDFDFNTPIEKPTVIEGTYEAIDRYYTITYFDGDNNVFDTEKVEFEKLAKGTKKIPTKLAVGNDAYKFVQWDFDFNTPVTQNHRVYAEFSRVDRYYDISFYNDNGEFIELQRVEYLDSAKAPEKLPVKEESRQFSYKFKGWDKDFTNVTENLDVYAVFEQTIRKYNVTFIDGNGVIFATQQVEFGKNAAIPVGIPRKDPKDDITAYKFIEWDNSLDRIVEDRTLTARFIEVPRYYEVIFYDGDNNEVSRQTVEYLDKAIEPTVEITKSPSKEYIYEFSKWDKAFDAVESNLEIHPEFKESLRPYKVYFLDGNNDIYAEQTVLYGQNAVLPEGKPRKQAVGETGYKFVSWNTNYHNIQGETTVTANFTEVERYYYVTFMRGTMILKTDKVEYGYEAVAPTKLFDTHPKENQGYEYYFISWDKDFSFIEQDLTVNLKYGDRLKEYTVTLIIGEEQTTQIVKWGQNVIFPTNVTKKATEQIVYKFKNWSNDGKSIKQDMTIEAIFDEIYNYYEVKFYDGNNRLIKTDKVKPGEDAIEPLNVSKMKTNDTVFVFVNWDKDFTEVTSNLDVYAQFKEVDRYYEVIFLNHDGTELSRQLVEYGKDAKLPENPTKPSTDMYEYQFEKWDDTHTMIASNKTLKPIFSEKVKAFEVIFKDGDGNILSTQYIEYGKNAIAPEDTTKTPTDTIYYVFIGWNKEYTNITKNIVIEPEFKEVDRYYDVTFLGENNEVLDKQVIEYGKDAVDPRPKLQVVIMGENQDKVYAVVAWDKTFTNVKSNLNIHAIYEIVDRYYEVIFLNHDGTELSRQTIEYGKAAIEPTHPEKVGNEDFRYDFEKWSEDFSFVTSNLEIYAVFKESKTKYTVTFLDGDGNVFDTQVVLYGKDAVSPGKPGKSPLPKEMYVFTGWKESLLDVKEDRTITPLFDKTVRAFTVIFKDASGNTLKVETVEYGKNATAPTQIPEKEGTHYITYVPTWDKPFDNITEDLVIELYYKEIERIFEAKFLDYKGDILKTVTGPYETFITLPEDPEKPMTDIYRYVFIGWNPEFSETLTKDVTYTPVFDEILRLYTVTFKDGNGEVFDIQDIPYGNSPVVPKGTPEKEATQQYYYVFRMWESTNFKVYQDTTIESIYYRFLQQYKVTFIDENGRELKVQMVEYGTGATAPESDIIPTKPQTHMYTYVFTGWDKAFSYITEDITIQVVYTAALRKYTYTFYDDDQTTIIKRIIGHYGDKIVQPEDPKKESKPGYEYQFIGWSPQPADLLTQDVTFVAIYKEIPKILKVIFIDGNGEVFEIQEVKYHGAASTPNRIPLKNPNAVYEYAFVGWIESYDDITEDTYVYAEFEQALRKYTVIFMIFDDKKEIKVEYGRSAYGKVPTPIVTGYRFIKWDRDLSSITANITTKAIMEANDYVIRFHQGTENDEKVIKPVIGDMDELVKKYDEKIQLPKISYKRQGYDFIGWRTEDTDYPVYSDMHTFTLKEEGLELYAMWQPIVYNITYDLDGGTANNDTEFTVEDTVILNEAKKDNYIFQGWYLVEGQIEPENKQKQAIETISKMMIQSFNRVNVSFMNELSDTEEIEQKDIKVDKITEGTVGNITLRARYQVGLIQLKEESKVNMNMYHADIATTKLIEERVKYDDADPVYLIGKGIYLNQTLGELRTKFINDNLVFLDSNNKELSDDKVVATGYQIVVRSDDNPNQVLDRVHIVLYGDTNGDGDITFADRNIMSNYINKSNTNIYASRLLAADVNRDGDITFADRNIISNHINKSNPIWS
ncbi:conserved hypothetical protein (predicted large exoproteins involved in heme utilization or adhesion) [Alteracholeplasma palmae J233]|uniref:Dockerin domain-containing protein n=1 Tax=Alteracholeplasma palmae (strain ATCC 49389 / J233) TaxID=1318466 RepID=U4KKQ5_ALTPJ|nr:InlB B-repeat-containing protein [Alteracholeplasma palmae]CCV64247.1 conserved hypothetical protein (predicted large exoproteins involved in heme utilization or adhesion) [Alteracholeplasma palmae J233]